MSSAHVSGDVSEIHPDFFPNSDKYPQPHTLWIGCSDSKVPEPSITAAQPGVIFVHRNIANQLRADDTSLLSVLAYAINYLGIENVIIIGHSGCGGALTSLKAAQAPGFVPVLPITTIENEPVYSPLNRWLEPLTQLAYSLQLPDQGAESLEILVRENVKVQVENLANTETIINAWIHGTPQKQKVYIHGWVYEFSTGHLKDLGITRGPPN